MPAWPCQRGGYRGAFGVGGQGDDAVALGSEAPGLAAVVGAQELVLSGPEPHPPAAGSAHRDLDGD